MKYLFLGSFCEPNEEKQLLQWSKTGIQSSIICFQRNMLQGIKDGMDSADSLDVINYYPIGTWPKTCNRIFICKESEKNYRRLFLFNLPILKQLCYQLQSKFYINRWVHKYKEENKCIITYDLLRPYLKTISTISPDVKTLRMTIVADLLNEYGYNKHETGIKGWLKSKIGIDSMNRVKKLDFCGLLTKQMSIPLQLKEGQYTIIEGFSNKNRYFSPLKEKSNIIFFYGGVLSKEYQIDKLIEAFQSINNKKFELWLCGSGSYVKNIIEIARNNHKIKYLGHKTQEEIAEIQSQSTILINPRQNVGEYTKYSFPSKIIEYLSTARPIIAYKLDGIPDCYYDYIITPKDNSVQSLSETLIYVASIPYEELREIGLAGRAFVLDRTEPFKQIKKLVQRDHQMIQ